MRCSSIYATAFGVAGVAASCLAPTLARPINVSVEASTLGFGVQVATPIVPGTLDIALSINHFSYSHSDTTQKIIPPFLTPARFAFRLSQCSWITTRSMASSA